MHPEPHAASPPLAAPACLIARSPIAPRPPAMSETAVTPPPSAISRPVSEALLNEKVAPIPPPLPRRRGADGRSGTAASPTCSSSRRSAWASASSSPSSSSSGGHGPPLSASASAPAAPTRSATLASSRLPATSRSKGHRCTGCAPFISGAWANRGSAPECTHHHVVSVTHGARTRSV